MAMTNNWVQCPTCSKCNFQIVVVINHRLSSGAIIPGDRLHPQQKTLSTIPHRLGQDSGHYCCPTEVIVVSLLCPWTPCQVSTPLWAIHTSYLSFFIHGQNFWIIKFTPKNANFSRQICKKAPLFRVKSVENANFSRYTGQKKFTQASLVGS